MEFSTSPPGILRSGLELAEREARILQQQGKTVAVIAVANQSGISVTGTAAFDTKVGTWMFSGELEKLRDQKSANWRVTATWSK
jgi:hypothetical protein